MQVNKPLLYGGYNFSLKTFNFKHIMKHRLYANGRQGYFKSLSR
jgi:hypothetical protein